MRLGALACLCAAVLGACGARSGLPGGEQAGAQAGASPGVAGTQPQVGTGGKSAGGGKAGQPASGGVGVAGAFGGNAAAGVSAGGATAGAGLGGGGAGGVAGCGGGSGEVCNGLDDDCDGEIDEDLPLEVVEGPIAVRDHEGRTDVGLDVDCVSCGWAWHPQLVMPGGELGVVWYLGIWGGDEQPSGFFRRLSWQLEPQGSVRSLGPQYVMSMLARATTGTGADLLAFVERVNHSDVPSFGRLNADFEPVASVQLPGCSSASYGGLLGPLAPGLVGCASVGVVHAFSVDNDGQQVLAHEQHDLRLPGETMTDLGGRPVAALKGSSGLLAVPIRPGAFYTPMQLWTRQVSAQGAPLADGLRQDLGGQKGLQLEGLFAAPDGYLLFGDDRRSGEWPGGRFVVPLGPDGRVTGEIVHYDQGRLADFDEVAVLRVGSGFVVAETTAQGLRIARLDGTGAVLQELQENLSPYSQASLLFARGHLYVAYAESPSLSGGENRVVVARFSCARKAP